MKPHEGILTLESMHFAQEIVSAEEVRKQAATVGKKELGMAKHLITSMAEKWEPEAFIDDYANQVMRIIQQKVEAGGKALPAKAAPKMGAVDLMAALEKSLADAGKKKPGKVTVMKPRKKAG